MRRISFAQCKSLRELSEQRVEADGKALCAAAAAVELVWRRSRHVVHENARTVEAATALRAAAPDAVKRLGTLMLASHRSLQHDFEVCASHLPLYCLCLLHDVHSAVARSTPLTH